MASERIDLNRLFIALPELTFRVRLIEDARRAGLIDDVVYAKIVAERRRLRLLGKVEQALSSGTIIERLMAVAPELISEDVVNLLRGIEVDRSRFVFDYSTDQRKDPKYKVKFAPLISAEQATSLKLAIRTLKAATRGGLPTDSQQLAVRLGRVLNVQASATRIDQLVRMGVLSSKEGDRAKEAVKVGREVGSSLVKAVRAKSLLDALLLLGRSRVDSSLVQAMVRSGLIPANVGNAYEALITLGYKEWKVFEGVGNVEGLRRRMMLVLTGSFNRPLLDFLYETNVLTASQWASLQVAEVLARNVNDRLLEDQIKRRYRVRPGEAPIKTFAKASRLNDREILRLLAQASSEARQQARVLAAKQKVGASVRSRQYILNARGLHETMRSLWDGVGYLTIWGERETAAAAVESIMSLQRDLLTGRFAQLGQSLEWQAKAGVDSYVSRQENTLTLSRRIYKNYLLSRDNIDRRISIGLLNGLSPAELAADIEKFISPNVPGGTSYAAMRLARTEINNAFHFSTIRYTRENPWVRGYKWNISGSHGKPDICNDYATDDHDGLGAGVFKKANVPGKPHPHCLCYITTVQMSPEEFARASAAGRFDAFYRTVAAGNTYGDQPSSAGLAEYARRGLSSVPNSISL